MLLHKQQHHLESANLLSYGHEFPSPYVTVNQRPRIHKAVGYEQEHGALQSFVPNGVCIHLALGGGGGGGGSWAPPDPPPHGHPGTLPSYTSEKVR